MLKFRLRGARGGGGGVSVNVLRFKKKNIFIPRSRLNVDLE